MKISTEIFKKYEKLILSYTDQKNKYLYLDFKNGYISFNFDNHFAARIKADIKSDTNNVFLDSVLFLNLCRNYNELCISENFEILANEDRFKIPHSNNDIFYNAFTKDYTNFKSYRMSKIDIENILQAYSFIGSSQTDYEGVNVNNCITAYDGTKLYTAKTEFKYDNIVLSKSLIKAIRFLTKNLNSENNLTFFKTKDGLYIVDKEIEIYCSDKINLVIPNPEDDNIRKKYDHETMINIEKNKLSDILSFLNIFTKDVKNQRVCFNIENKEKAFLSLNESIEVVKYIPLIYCSDNLIGKSFYFSLPHLNLALSSIDDDKVCIKVDTDKPAIGISGVDRDVKKNIAIVRLILN